jgi:hypothetical protein
MKRAAFLIAITLGLATSPCMAQEDAPEEPRYPPSSVRWKLIAGGLGLTVAAYGGGLLTSYLAPDQPGILKLQIPVVGPFIAMPENKCVERGSTDCTPELFGRIFVYGIAGLAQIGGLALVTQGLVMKTQAQAPQPKPEAARFVAPIPIVSRNMIGFGVVGNF